MSVASSKTTHAQRRRKESQEALRGRLRGAQYLRRLKEIAERAETVEPSAIPALKLKADIYLKLLAKCLPDLKAVEHSGQVTHTTLSDAELDRRISELSREAGIAAPAGGESAPAEQTTH